MMTPGEDLPGRLLLRRIPLEIQTLGVERSVCSSAVD